MVEGAREVSAWLELLQRARTSRGSDSGSPFGLQCETSADGRVWFFREPALGLRAVAATPLPDPNDPARIPWREKGITASVLFPRPGEKRPQFTDGEIDWLARNGKISPAVAAEMRRRG